MKRLSAEQVAQEIDRVLKGIMNYHPQKVILFGSLARGDYHAGSDMDLILIKIRTPNLPTASRKRWNLWTVQ